VDYYEALGYELRDMVSPDAVSSGPRLESSPGASAVVMRSLLLRPAPQKSTGSGPSGDPEPEHEVNNIQASINAMGSDSTRLWTETLHRSLMQFQEADNKSSLAYM